eukprot:SAG11_NODE_30923_length_296_cov_0.969543_1_plen_62_part_01
MGAQNAIALETSSICGAMPVGPPASERPLCQLAALKPIVGLTAGAWVLGSRAAAAQAGGGHD